MKKYIRVLLLAALVCSLLAGCSIETKSSKDSQDESNYHLYYLNESETVLREEPYSPGEETADFMVKDLMQQRCTGWGNQSSSGRCFHQFL